MDELIKQFDNGMKRVMKENNDKLSGDRVKICSEFNLFIQHIMNHPELTFSSINELKYISGDSHQFLFQLDFPSLIDCHKIDLKSEPLFKKFNDVIYSYFEKKYIPKINSFTESNVTMHYFELYPSTSK